MNPSKNYIALTEGRMAKSEFLRQARQAFPHLIGAGNSFEDALKILTRKGLINEELVYQNKADKFPLESIERGIRYELEIMDVYDIHHPSQEQYKKARQRAIDNLGKDPLYYINKIAEGTKQPKQEDETKNGDHMKEVKPGKKNLQEGRYIEEKKSLTMRPDENHGRNHVAPERNFEKENPANEKYESDPDMQTANKLFVALLAKSNTNQNTLRTMANGAQRSRTPDECLKMVQKKFPAFKRPFKDTMRNFRLTWFRGRNGNSLEYKSIREDQIQEAPTEDLTQLNKKFLDLYIKYKDGNYQIRDKESGELKPGRALAPETAAQKACMVVRKSMNAPRFRPDRNTIASCSVGRGKLQYQGENNGVPTFNYAWSIKEDELGEASKNGGDPVWTQLYQHFLKKYKEAKDPNADHNARIKANQAFKKYQEKHSMQESKKGPDIDKLVLKESLIKAIGRVLNEAATANLARLSDENASVAELPGIINSLENIVTEIESFWIKEQQKIQGVFDQVGNIKNEDGLPVGYKFVQPMLDSLKKDLEPVLAKISLEGLNLPEAPAPDQTQVNDPNAEPDPNAPAPVPEKQTVFSPAEKEPLQETKNRRYTK